MDGAKVLHQLLTGYTPLTGLVPATRIQAGVLPQGIALPALSITTVSMVDRNLLNAEAYRLVTERVQVTVLASSYPQMKDVLRKVRAAASDRFPTVTGLRNVTVHTDSTGPDFINESASIYLIPQDFRVTYSERRLPAPGARLDFANPANSGLLALLLEDA